MPDYYTQNFHYQSGGWLTAELAQVYDVQVETLFFGAAGAMRRQAIPPIAEFVRGRDQRQLRLLDVACGSGRFLGQLAQAFPAMPLTGSDMSQAYLDEAARFLHGRRNVTFQQANAETLPFADGGFDIVTCVYLFHELPNEVRRRVTSEIARILKPGGLFVFVDSLQWGDVEGYDGLLKPSLSASMSPTISIISAIRWPAPVAFSTRRGFKPQTIFRHFCRRSWSAGRAAEKPADVPAHREHAGDRFHCPSYSKEDYLWQITPIARTPSLWPG